MNNNRNYLWLNPLLNGGVSLMTYFIARFVWIRTGIPQLKVPSFVWCSAFPLALFLFSILSYEMVRRGKLDPKILYYDGYWGFSAIGYIALLISWQVWNLFSFPLSLAYFLWIAVRSLNALRYIDTLDPKLQDYFSTALYFIVSINLAPFVTQNSILMSGYWVIVAGIVFSAVTAL
jgi:hypothetical protein